MHQGLLTPSDGVAKTAKSVQAATAGAARFPHLVGIGAPYRDRAWLTPSPFVDTRRCANG